VKEHYFGSHDGRWLPNWLIAVDTTKPGAELKMEVPT
jgi:hypothetical protein